MTAAPPIISVNGVVITPEQINAEVQYHPAPALLDARYQAMRALVVRELLLQRAAKIGLCDAESSSLKPDAVIDRLLQEEIKIPAPTESELRRYYENNLKQFYTSPLCEVSHILYLAPPEDAAARTAAQERATAALAELHTSPERFAEIALRDSACPSAKDGGSLGQISRNQTLPEFEEALLKMKAGDISAAPVASTVGYHIIQLQRRVEGNQLPYEAVAKWIEDHLCAQSWQRAVSQYIQVLAGEAEIVGFRLTSAETPLVQ